jgi:hypothetical protein
MAEPLLSIHSDKLKEELNDCQSLRQELDLRMQHLQALKRKAEDILKNDCTTPTEKEDARASMLFHHLK